MKAARPLAISRPLVPVTGGTGSHRRRRRRRGEELRWAARRESRPFPPLAIAIRHELRLAIGLDLTVAATAQTAASPRLRQGACRGAVHTPRELELRWQPRWRQRQEDESANDSPRTGAKSVKSDAPAEAGRRAAASTTGAPARFDRLIQEHNAVRREIIDRAGQILCIATPKRVGMPLVFGGDYRAAAEIPAGPANRPMRPLAGQPPGQPSGARAAPKAGAGGVMRSLPRPRRTFAGIGLARATNRLVLAAPPKLAVPSAILAARAAQHRSIELAWPKPDLRVDSRHEIAQLARAVAACGRVGAPPYPAQAEARFATPIGAPPDTDRLVDQVIDRLDRRLRSDRLRRGL